MTNSCNPKNICGPAVEHFRLAIGLSRYALCQLLRNGGYVISLKRLRSIEEQTCTVYAQDLIALADALSTTADALLAQPPFP